MRLCMLQAQTKAHTHGAAAPCSSWPASPAASKAASRKPQNAKGIARLLCAKPLRDVSADQLRQHEQQASNGASQAQSASAQRSGLLQSRPGTKQASFAVQSAWQQAHATQPPVATAAPHGSAHAADGAAASRWVQQAQLPDQQPAASLASLHASRASKERTSSPAQHSTVKMPTARPCARPSSILQSQKRAHRSSDVIARAQDEHRSHAPGWQDVQAAGGLDDVLEQMSPADCWLTSALQTRHGTDSAEPAPGPGQDAPADLASVLDEAAGQRSALKSRPRWHMPMGALHGAEDESAAATQGCSAGADAGPQLRRQTAPATEDIDDAAASSLGRLHSGGDAHHGAAQAGASPITEDCSDLDTAGRAPSPAPLASVLLRSHRAAAQRVSADICPSPDAAQRHQQHAAGSGWQEFVDSPGHAHRLRAIEADAELDAHRLSTGFDAHEQQDVATALPDDPAGSFGMDREATAEQRHILHLIQMQARNSSRPSGSIKRGSKQQKTIASLLHPG